MLTLCSSRVGGASMGRQAMNCEQVDSRAEFLEWAQVRARRILDIHGDALFQAQTAPRTEVSKAALLHELEAAISAALLEVFDCVVEGE